ncbi:5-formyltetrahydrofolate cyclo-ligase, mitochondrial-like isoform X2 [Manihot esculenta]|uniref:5-formyltetrahydrofolate cyclo-ligase, mitochondrial-like isoform X2 n=1 Tax=Manihot esculenta TaxID=3983 RepID=UPI000B5D15AB|nr:5-formyltetrahydrofolate cyclo-ligase, mitochondrial-like isoform X2 [Manihot esculenta]XP_043806434.1 5-formyltetrahydrofolate cyclo-ligase, mitochondrial-like isoform X2 [Manihot esculenta]
MLEVREDGLAFDRCRRSLGHGGRKYQELARERIGRSLSLLHYPTLMDGVIPVTLHHVLVDALATPSGMIPISSSALARSDVGC